MALRSRKRTRSRVGNRASGGLTPFVGTPVVWTSLTQCAQIGTALVKTLNSDGDNSGALGSLTIVRGDGFAEFVLPAASAGIVYFGLSNDSPGVDWRGMDFGVRWPFSGGVVAEENGTLGSGATAKEGDRICIAVESGAVKFRCNGTLFHTAVAAPTYPLKVCANLYTAGTSLPAAYVSGILA